MTDRDTIHKYLKSLSKYLSRLGKADADDVIREIESHIYDALEAREEEGRQAGAEAILAGFGEPRDLAAGYVEHILDGAAPPKGFRAIQRVKKGATKGLYFATLIFGFGISLALVLVGIMKVIDPANVGVWVSSNETLVIGSLSDVPAGTRELLGWWAVPVLIGLGVGAAYLTRRLTGVLSSKI